MEGIKIGYELDMEDNVIVVGDSMFLEGLKRLKDNGEITLQQYAESLRRARDRV